MFDDGERGPRATGVRRPPREQTLAELRRRMAAVGAADGATAGAGGADRAHAAEPGAGVLGVAGPLGELFPRGGLPRGGVVSIADPVGAGAAPGATSLVLSLLAAVAGRWCALVGRPELGLAAAAELGVDLERTVVVPDPGPDVLQVISVLADGVEMIVAGAPAGDWGSAGRRRVVTGRLRQRGTLLIVDGRWPGADLVLTARHTAWIGIGRGHGRLRDRELTVTVGGRRTGGRSQEHRLLLAGRRNGAVQVVRTERDPLPTVVPVAG